MANLQLVLLFLVPFHGQCSAYPGMQKLSSASAIPGPVVDTVDGKVR